MNEIGRDIIRNSPGEMVVLVGEGPWTSRDVRRALEFKDGAEMNKTLAEFGEFVAPNPREQGQRGPKQFDLAAVETLRLIQDRRTQGWDDEQIMVELTQRQAAAEKP